MSAHAVDHTRKGHTAVFKLRNAAVAAVAVVALGATIASGSDSSDNKAEKVDADGNTVSGETFNIGDTVKLGDWSVQVYGIQDPLVPTNGYITPAAGNRFVQVDTEVTNHSDKAEMVSSMACFDLRDSDNKRYTIAITGESTGLLDGEVAPGASLRGNLDYEVPDSATGLQLHFKCDFLSSGSAVINLT